MFCLVLFLSIDQQESATRRCNSAKKITPGIVSKRSYQPSEPTPIKEARLGFLEVVKHRQAPKRPRNTLETCRSVDISLEASGVAKPRAGTLAVHLERLAWLV
jgi:hypothetical protein